MIWCIIIAWILTGIIPSIMGIVSEKEITIRILIVCLICIILGPFFWVWAVVEYLKKNMDKVIWRKN